MKSCYLTFSLFHDDIEYRVSGLYTPPDPGQTSGPPERCYPPEDDAFEIDEISCGNKDVSRFPQHIRDHLDNMALEKAADIYSSQKAF